ncbi:STAS domain-containing protein [Rivularia sp. UHCC 0363]|uniref:STAS domain-containing protein n=1 Tax=Rivularia sp. UHCC 0363 TaxID=3110244 RepID=UPI002B20060C|nr:STAS domain-containing protein [Rivularia sp. UHCC 0363]MEA5596788.1 STAS domain-containing protein [Rivularia sp. UHCC 0363]
MTEHIKVVQPSGVLDATISQDFREQVIKTLESKPKIVLVDLKDITFMDSSGLGALVLAFKTLRAADTKLVLCSINEQIKILFELTGMDKVFEIFSNQDEFNKAVLTQIA